MDSSGAIHGFTVSETSGVWQLAQPLANIHAFGPDTELNSVSCTGAGDCLAGGLFGDVATNSLQALVMIQLKDYNDEWQPAFEAPGTASLNWAANASVVATSCSNNGYCAAGGSYLDQDGNYQSFVNTTVLTRLPTPMHVAVTIVKKVVVGHSKSVTLKMLASGMLGATGDVDFFRTGLPLCSASIVGGQAACTATETIERARITVNAIYQGDEQYAPAVLEKSLLIK